MARSESHFFDFKSKRIAGKKLQKTVVAMANADGGEIAIGIENPVNESGDPLARWDGFDKQEDANQLIQNVSLEISPTPPVDAEFLGIEGMPKKGLALLVTVSKSAEVHHTSANEYYARKSAQDLPLSTDAVMNVRLSKGLISYEDQFVANYDVDELVAAKELSTFLRTYSPATEPFEFL